MSRLSECLRQRIFSYFLDVPFISAREVAVVTVVYLNE
jgi:hypothetical protein